MAGTSPSFPCPSCRTLILLPPWGGSKLQSNFYIEDDSATSSSSRPRRLCDVCADDREATHLCVQCQQRYCLPCRKYHDSFRSCYGHTVVSLTEEDDGCGKGALLSEKQKVDLCPKQPDQRVLLHCTKCKVSLCLQCKLIQHEGHSTQDLADASAEVKDKLKDRLGTLTQEMTEIDHIVTAVQVRCSKLQEQKRTTEAAFRARADTLQQWVKQSLEEAVSSLQSSSEQRAKPWQEGAEQLGSRKQALQAQQDHILRVLKDGQEADLVSLEAQLSSCAQEDDLTLTQVKAELTRNIPTLAVEYNITAVNLVQLRTFIGMLVPPQQTSGPGRAVTPSLPTSVQGKPSAKGSDVTGTPSLPTSVQGKPSAAVSAKGSDVTGTPSLPTSVQGKPSAKGSDVTGTPSLPTSVQGKPSVKGSHVTGTPNLPTSVQGKPSVKGSDVTVTPNLPTSVQGKPSTAVSAKGSDVTGTPSLPTSVQGKPSVKGSDVTVTPNLPTSVQGKPSTAVSAKGSDVTHRGDCPPPARGLVKVGMKKPPREFQYSADKGSSVIAMCPISQRRLWVMHSSPPTRSVCLTLLDAEGRVLTTVENLKDSDGLVAMTDDVILSWTWDDSSVQLVTPDGNVRTCHLGSQVGRILSSATNDIHYLAKWDDKRLYRVELVNQNQSGHAAPRSAASHPKMRATPAVKDQPTLSVTEVVLEDMSSLELPLQASAGGRYFVFIDSGIYGDTHRVKVCGKAGSRRSAFISSYQPETGKCPADACFCQIDGQEMLLVTVRCDKKVHVIDYTDGGRLVRYLDTGPLNLDRPWCLATDYDRQVWIGCKGGKVAVVDL
ncbi:hypothetical protein ACOMHN_057036 [Nucella lapillus]